MSGSSLEVVLRVSGGSCLDDYKEGFWRVFVNCQEGDWKESELCLEVIWKVSIKIIWSVRRNLECYVGSLSIILFFLSSSKPNF